MASRDIGLFLEDIKSAIAKIEEFSKGLDEKGFLKDDLRQSAIIRQLEIIGEAVKNLPDPIKKKNPQIPWKEIAGLRDVLSHAYFGVMLNRVWNIILYDLQDLKKAVDNIKLNP